MLQMEFITHKIQQWPIASKDAFTRETPLSNWEAWREEPLWTQAAYLRASVARERQQGKGDNWLCPSVSLPKQNWLATARKRMPHETSLCSNIAEHQQHSIPFLL